MKSTLIRLAVVAGLGMAVTACRAAHSGTVARRLRRIDRLRPKPVPI